MKKLKGDTLPGIIAILFGLFLLVVTLTGENMAILVAKKRGNVPGPGFFPFLCSALLIIFGVLLALRGFRQNGSVDFFAMTEEMRGNVKVALACTGGLVAFLILWKLTNLFIPCVFVFSVYLNRLFKRSWVFTLIFTVVITAFIYLLFVRGFSVTFRV